MFRIKAELMAAGDSGGFRLKEDISMPIGAGSPLGFFLLGSGVTTPHLPVVDCRILRTVGVFRVTVCPWNP